MKPPFSNSSVATWTGVKLQKNLRNVLANYRMIYPVAKIVRWYIPFTASRTKFSCSLGWFGLMACARLTDCNINKSLPVTKERESSLD